VRQSTVELLFRRFKLCRGCPRQPIRLQRCVSGRRKVRGKDTRLALAGQIVELGKHQIGVARQATFRVALGVFEVVQRSKRRGQPAQRHDQPELCSAQLDDQAELHALGECEAVDTFRLRLRERIADRQIVRNDLIPAVRSKRQIADPIRRVERPSNELTSTADVCRPRHDGAADVHIGSGLIARQTAFLDQVIAQLGKSEAVLVVVETRPCKHPQPDVAKTRTVAVAVLEAQTDHAADDER